MAHSENEERSLSKAWEASLYREVEEHWTRCPFCKATNGEISWEFTKMEAVGELLSLAETYLSYDTRLVWDETGVVSDDLSGGDVPGLGWSCEYLFLENPDPKKLRKVIGCVLSNILKDPTNTFLHRLVVPDEQTIQGLQEELSNLSALMSDLADALAPPKPGPLFDR